MKKVISIILLFGLNLYGFNDLNYLFSKYKIRKTIETLEALKTLYPKYSQPYRKIVNLENYFMQNMPISAFSTYVRIKLHNIIDNKLNEEQQEKEEFLKNNNILKANTNLNYLYILKLQKEKSIRKNELKNKETLGGKVPANSQLFQPQNINQEQTQYNQIKQYLKTKGF